MRLFHWKKIIFAIIMAALLSGAFLYGFRQGQQVPKTLIVEGVSSLSPDQAVDADFSTFWEAWQAINEAYLKNKDIKSQEKVYGAINGLVGSLGDPHSQFFSPKDSKKFQEDIQGNFGGIGAEIGMRQNRLVIIAPIKGTPASKELRSGDHIVKIDDTFTEGLTVDQAVSLIRGTRGTAVVLSILRDDWTAPKEFKIIRDIITVPTLDFEMKGDIAHVALHNFNANLTGLFRNTIESSPFRSAKGMVLDLRNNPGGFLTVAVDMAGIFLKNGTLILSEKGINSEEDKEFRARGSGRLAEFPVVVLVNGGSASASEILAGALKDQRKIKIVGEKTFGKGTVQELIDLHDNSSLKLTVAHWVLPSGAILDGEGIAPDIEVKLNDKDIENGKDPQLEKAIEILRGIIR